MRSTPSLWQRLTDNISLVQAKTGTGKTTAFLLPAIQNSLHQPSPRKGQVAILVLSPTRELALQIAAEAERLVSRLMRPFQVHTAFGGTAYVFSESFTLRKHFLDVLCCSFFRSISLNKTRGISKPYSLNP